MMPLEESVTNPTRAITDIQSGDRIYMGTNGSDKYISVTSVLGVMPKQMYLGRLD